MAAAIGMVRLAGSLIGSSGPMLEFEPQLLA